MLERVEVECPSCGSPDLRTKTNTVGYKVHKCNRCNLEFDAVISVIYTETCP